MAEADDDTSDEVEERTQVHSNELSAIMEDTANFDGPYWANGTIGTKTKLYMLSAITTYNNINHYMVLGPHRSTVSIGV